MREFLREPLVHFLVIGGLLFAGDALLSADETATSGAVVSEKAPASETALDSEDERIIHIDQAVRDQVARGWEDAHGAPPTPKEMATLLEGWIDTRILYREGLLRGLDKGDPSIVQRVASKMSTVLGHQVLVPEPTEDELRNYYQNHSERWSRRERIDFVHVFIADKSEAGRAQAGEILKGLEAGGSPNGLGDRFSGGRRYRGRDRASLQEIFGAEFVSALQTSSKPDSEDSGRWILTRSTHGWHVLRVEGWQSAVDTPFEAAKLDVEKAWGDEARLRGVEKALAELRGTWRIVDSDAADAK